MTTKQKTNAANEHETNADAHPTEARSAPRLKTTEAAQTAESEAEQAREREIAGIARRGAPDPLAEFHEAWGALDPHADPITDALYHLRRDAALAQELVEEKAEGGDGWLEDLSMALLILTNRLDATLKLSKTRFAYLDDAAPASHDTPRKAAEGSHVAKEKEASLDLLDGALENARKGAALLDEELRAMSFAARGPLSEAADWLASARSLLISGINLVRGDKAPSASEVRS